MSGRHLVLVGLPGAGKSTVGALAAEQLQLPFTDLDERIEAAAGRSVPTIFAVEGEARFRQLERSAMEAALAETPGVIAAGGGWAAEPGNLEAARAAGALIAWLTVSPEVAARRLEGKSTRPLLAGGAPAERLGALLAARVHAYQRADAFISNEGDDPTVAVAALTAWFRAANLPFGHARP